MAALAFLVTRKIESTLVVMSRLLCSGSVDGVKVLLKHGAQRDLAIWGDPGCTPLETAKDKSEILTLLQAAERPAYVRATDPALPQSESAEEGAVNRQREIREATGLVFQTDMLKQSE